MGSVKDKNLGINGGIMSNLRKRHVPLTHKVSESGFHGQPYRPLSREVQVVKGTKITEPLLKRIAFVRLPGRFLGGTAHRGGKPEFVGGANVAKGLGVEVKADFDIPCPFPDAILEFQKLPVIDLFQFPIVQLWVSPFQIQ